MYIFECACVCLCKCVHVNVWVCCVRCVCVYFVCVQRHAITNQTRYEVLNQSTTA